MAQRMSLADRKHALALFVGGSLAGQASGEMTVVEIQRA